MHRQSGSTKEAVKIEISVSSDLVLLFCFRYVSFVVGEDYCCERQGDNHADNAEQESPYGERQ